MKLTALLKNKYSALTVFSLVSILVYFNCFSIGFISDDFTYLLGVQQNGWQSVTNNFNDDFFLPLTHIVQLIIFTFFGENDTVFHAFQLVVHVAVAWQIYLLVKENSSSEKTIFPFLCGLIFLVLPYHTESVIWLASVGYLLSLFFSLLSIRHYLNENYFLFYLFLVLAIFSKEMGYIVPLIIVILDWYQFRVYRIKSKAIPIGLIVIAILGIRFLVLGSLIGGYGNAIHLNTNLLTLVKVPCVYLLKYITFFRYSQSTILSLLVICLLIGISTPYVKQLIKIKSKRPVVFIFLLFIATLLPVINLETTSLFAIQSDRYGYFNAVVFAVALSQVLTYWKSNFTFLLSILVVAAFSTLTIQDTFKWKNASIISQQYLSALSSLAIDNSSILIINAPDNYQGAYVLRNGINDFLKSKNKNVQVSIINYQTVNSKKWGEETEKDTDYLNKIDSDNHKKYDQIIYYVNGKFKSIEK